MKRILEQVKGKLNYLKLKENRLSIEQFATEVKLNNIKNELEETKVEVKKLENFVSDIEG